MCRQTTAVVRVSATRRPICHSVDAVAVDAAVVVADVHEPITARLFINVDLNTHTHTHKRTSIHVADDV
jgi:hypothetical protein